MSMEQYWFRTGSGKPNYSKENQPLCYSARRKSHTASLRLSPGLRGDRPATKRLSRGIALKMKIGLILFKYLGHTAR